MTLPFSKRHYVLKRQFGGHPQKQSHKVFSSVGSLHHMGISMDCLQKRTSGAKLAQRFQKILVQHLSE